MPNKQRRRPGRHTAPRPAVRWKRRLAWLGPTLLLPLLVAVLAILIEHRTPIGTNPYVSPPATSATPPKTSQEPSGPAITVDVLRTSQDPGMGESWVFPTALDLTGPELRFLANARAGKVAYAQYERWAQDRGGAFPTTVAIQLVLEGNRDKPVRIIGMKPTTKRCTIPMSGTLLYSPGAGQDESIKIGIDLDKPRPVAQVIEAGEWKGDYFADKTVSLKRAEQVTFQILATTSKQSCEFALELTIVENGRTVVQTVADAQHPLRVSGLVKAPGDLGSINFAAYDVLYVGGVLNPTGNGAFIRKDPATYDERG
jgi:hypothetical protein